ncbi:MAG: EpsG family protein, partial [Mycoplasmataceae bacterium]|nr:EpsG family protein [Mycoplasmataceae bacterium]
MFFVLFLLLFLVSGLRVDIGIDYKNFERDYDDLTINYLKDNFTFFSEPVYLLTCIIFKFCGIHYCGFVFFISFFTLFP